MIARTFGCDEPALQALIEDRIGADDQAAICDHLSVCQVCQSKLDELAGDAQWWNETQVNLSGHTDLASREVRQTDNSSDVTSDGGLSQTPQHQSLAGWIRDILDPTDDPDCLGTYSGLPIRHVIGQGGMGIVLKAWDEELHRPLALKLLSPMLANNGSARQRFFREAQAAAAVVHPNIVPIYSVSGEGPFPSLVMPYIAGGNLQQRIDRDGPLPLSEILSIGLQVAEGLVAAHRLALVHRDIKPANILLDEGGHRAMVSDFGLARTLDDATITASGMVAGTPHYMSPEQARGEPVDARSDLYSLGGVLYCMATGRPPVRGDSPLAVLRGVSDQTPRSIRSINETLPSWFESLVMRLLDKNADSRISAAQDAANLLRGCIAHTRSPDKVDLPAELSRGRFGATNRLNILLAGCLVIAVVVAAVVRPPGRMNDSVGGDSEVNAIVSPDAMRSQTANPQPGGQVGSSDSLVRSAPDDFAIPPVVDADEIETNSTLSSLSESDSGASLEARLGELQTEINDLRSELGMLPTKEIDYEQPE